MSVLMQSRASFSDGKAVGIDGIPAEILRSIPWRALQNKQRQHLAMPVLDCNKDGQFWLPCDVSLRLAWL